MITDDPWLIKILKEGYKLEFDQLPPLSSVPTIDSTPKNPNKFAAMQDLIESMLEKAVIEEVQDNSPGFYSRFFIVPKRDSNKWRAILDLSTLNKFVSKQKFKMDTAEFIREQLHQGDWATSLDLSDAYHHVLIHPSHRKYLRFMFNGRVYQYQALVMGLTSSPRIFTRIIKAIRQFLQYRNIVIHQYLDDWLIQGKSPEVTTVHTQVLLHIAKHLGWLVNLEKLDL